jgi:hypothetical protein
MEAHFCMGKNYLLAYRYVGYVIRGEKKTEKPRKPEKNNRNNRIVKKNQLNRLKFWKNWPVRFYKPKTKKTKRTQIKKNRAKPVWTGFCPKKPNPNQSVWTGFGFFFKKFSLIICFYKNQTKPKIITLRVIEIVINIIFKKAHPRPINFSLHFVYKN